MKKILKYESEDGRQFDDMDACDRYEKLCAQVNGIVSRLRPRPDDCKFINDGGYIQQNALDFQWVRMSLLMLAKDRCDHKYIEKALNDMSAHPSDAGWVFANLIGGPLNNAWMRVWCTDDKFREWGQPYFRDNPQQADQVEYGSKEGKK